jgi:hypothetical protein
MAQGVGCIFTKGATTTAKGTAKGLVTVPSLHFALGVAGYLLGGPVKEEDAPLNVMSNDSFHEIVKDTFQIFLVGYGLFQA